MAKTKDSSAETKAKPRKTIHLGTTVLLTAIVQLLFGLAYYFDLEPFRHLFRPRTYDPNPAPLEGINEIFFLYWYSFVFPVAGLIIYLSRKSRFGFKGWNIALFAIWILVYFLVFYFAMVPNFSWGGHDLSFNWLVGGPPLLAATFSATAYAFHVQGMGKERTRIALDEGFQAISVFVVSGLMTPIAFLVLLFSLR